LSEEETGRLADHFDHVALLIAAALELPGQAAAQSTCDRLDAVLCRMRSRHADEDLMRQIVASLQAAIQTRFESDDAAPALH
jgi:hypothetical protein